LESFQPIKALVYAVFTVFLFLSELKPTNVLDGGAFSRDIFSFVAYQLLQRCQIFYANKQQFEKLQTLVQYLLLGKI